MLKVFGTFRVLSRRVNHLKLRFNSTFSSESFECREDWNKRLEVPLMKKVNLEKFYYELDNVFQQTGKASAVDVDIFVNSVKDDSFLDEMEDIVHRFRLTSEATNILPSTHHAFIRAFLSHGDADELLRILNDRLNYGIFPDDYCSVLLMNTFISSGHFRNAAKVAVLHMLQEDFSNPLIHYLSLYSCLKYLLNPTEWEKPEPVNETEEDEEEVRVRVKYIRNPYFDEHFDLRDPDDLIGKTLIMAGRLINNELGMTYQAIGYCLFRKFDLAESHCKSILKEKIKLYSDGLTIMKQKLSKLMNTETDDSTNLKGKVEVILKLIGQIEASGLVETESLESVVLKSVKDITSEREKELVLNQLEMYDDWINQRELLLQKEADEISRKKRLEEVARKKEELAKREEELFFFEREDELDLKVEEKQARQPPLVEGKKKKEDQNEEYIPPVVERSPTISAK